MRIRSSVTAVRPGARPRLRIYHKVSKKYLRLYFAEFSFGIIIETILTSSVRLLRHAGMFFSILPALFLLVYLILQVRWPTKFYVGPIAGKRKAKSS
jgi:hypothetical protein